MSKQVIIGDLHGSTKWKKVVEDNPDADRFIFIGDYLDSFDISPIEQLNNLEAICAFKKNTNKEVILLVGNHDHHYWPGVGDTGTSGFQPRMATSFGYCLQENKDLFQMVFVDEYKNVYSHAGLSKTFMRRINADAQGDPIAFVNEVFFYQPRKFCFSALDTSDRGNHKSQSCIWIRPESLYNDKWPVMQVVGHTEVSRISHPPKSERRGFYVVDAMPRQYLLCVDWVFKIKKV